MMLVVVAATSIIWLKDPMVTRQAQHNGTVTLVVEDRYTAITSTIVGTCIIAVTILHMGQMFCRLHTPTPESSALDLRTANGKAVADSSEFYVAAGPS